MEASHIPGLGEATTSLLTVRVQLVEQIKELDLKLRMLAALSQACQILMSIPGVGIQTSAAFSAAIDEAGRFRQSRNAGAYFGLVPRRHQSGELDWTGRITKQGDSMVRKLLYEAANSILTRSRESFALKTWRAENLEAPRPEESPSGTRAASRCHHACHAARRHFVRGLR
ncbi:transposase [Mesorhizobium sp. M0563]|uniref:transposase n=1 Tax=Mesorhizobium sp. M0563 TaxID=2956959 RepID=UPI00333C456E